MSPYLTQWFMHEQNRALRIAVSPTRTQIRSVMLEQLHHAMTHVPSGTHAKPALIRERIWDFMASHGIEFTDTNWRTIDKAYYRYRKSLANKRQLALQFPEV